METRIGQTERKRENVTEKITPLTANYRQEQ